MPLTLLASPGGYIGGDAIVLFAILAVVALLVLIGLAVAFGAVGTGLLAWIAHSATEDRAGRPLETNTDGTTHTRPPS